MSLDSFLQFQSFLYGIQRSAAGTASLDESARHAARAEGHIPASPIAAPLLAKRLVELCRSLPELADTSAEKRLASSELTHALLANRPLRLDHDVRHLASHWDGGSWGALDTGKQLLLVL